MKETHLIKNNLLVIAGASHCPGGSWEMTLQFLELLGWRRQTHGHAGTVDPQGEQEAGDPSAESAAVLDAVRARALGCFI